MLDNQVQEAVSTVSQALAASLGQALQAVILFGSAAAGFYQPGESDINLLLLVGEPAEIHGARDAFRPVWQEWQAVLQRPPWLATPALWSCLETLSPTLAAHLAETGQIVTGRAELPRVPPAHAELLALAEESDRLRQASAALLPDVLPRHERAARERLLRTLGRRRYRAPIDPASKAQILFGELQRALQPRLVGQEGQARSVALPDAPAHLPDLRAIYERLNEVILVLPDLGPDALARIDWPAVAGLLKEDYEGVQLTTPEQLRLAAARSDTLAVALGHYQHAWGASLLDGVQPDRPAILVAAARAAAEILIRQLPQAYLAATESETHRVIHDYQNKLLNIQLRHELLVRLAGLERVGPPEPLPPRETPTPRRIDAIVNHLLWWTDYYQKAAADQAG